MIEHQFYHKTLKGDLEITKHENTELKRAIAERDKRIKELETQVERLRCCGNCELNDCVRKDTDDFCVGCSRNWERWEPRT